MRQVGWSGLTMILNLFHNQKLGKSLQKLILQFENNSRMTFVEAILSRWDFCNAANQCTKKEKM